MQMKNIPFLFLLILGSCSRSTTSIQQDLIRMEQDRSKAIAAHDTLSLDKMYTDDFTGTTATGYQVNKAALLQLFKRDNPGFVFSNDDHIVSVLNRHTAVLTGR